MAKCEKALTIFYLFLQGSVTPPKGSDLSDHSIKANGSHASYSNIPATSHIIGQTPLEEFECIIHSMAQVDSPKTGDKRRTICS